MEGWVISDVMH